MIKSKKGLFIVISGPSGVGKGTIVKEVIEKYKATYLISMTTREKRKNEQEGVNYYFVTEEEFKEKIKNNDLLEYAIYNNNYYGTPKSKIFENINNNIDVLAEIEVKGAKKIKELYQDSILIYILPPSLNDLELRLKNRNTEDEETIKKRLNIAKEELKQIDIYDYFVVNDTIENSVNKIINILEAEKSKIKRNDIIL